MEKDVQKHFKAIHEKAGTTKEGEIVIMNAPTVEKLLKICDDHHHSEAQTRQLPKAVPEVPVVPVVSLATTVAPEPTVSRDPLGDIPTGGQGKDPLNVAMPSHCDEMLEDKTDDAVLSDSDLIIVTKTDSNVPTEGDVFCCEYCAFMANSEMQVISHISSHHDNMSINFKKLNRATCENPKEHVGCVLCSEVGSEIRIRQHHMERHPGHSLNMYRFQCSLCSQRKVFLKFVGLKVHFNRLHPGCQIQYTSLYGGSSGTGGKASELKTYKCPLCPYVRNLKPNAVNNIRQHVRQHFKAFMCAICQSTKYKTRSDVGTHYVREHPMVDDQEVIQDMQRVEEYNATMAGIIASAVDVTTEKVLKNTARKSTSAPHNSSGTQEYSYYGTRPEEVDMSKIMTSVEVNGMHLNMSAEKLSKIFDLNVVVAVEDCNLSVNLSSVFDS